MLKINNKKKIMIPILALVLVVAMAGTALATYPNYVWRSYFDLQKRDYEDTYQTYLIQRTLNIKDGASLSVDGDFGPGTESAVLAFQTDRQWLTNDGEVGPNTWEALEYSPCWETYVTPSHDDELDLDYHTYWRAFGPHVDYVRHYENGRWRVKRGNGDWRWAK